MNYIISENKLNSFLLDFFESNNDLSNLFHVVYVNRPSIDFYSKENEEWVFTYFPDIESYDFYETYSENDFPMIELNHKIYEDLENLFGEKIIKTSLLDWLNKTYSLESVEIFPN